MRNKIVGIFAICLGPAVNAQTLRSGEEVYQRTCVACHGSGLQGAPKLGDNAKWKPLFSEGQAVLTAHAWVGVRAMPARGGDATLNLEEFSRAVAWMSRQAGGSWQDPDAALLKKIEAQVVKRESSKTKK
jgi:cytochrome c5